MYKELFKFNSKKTNYYEKKIGKWSKQTYHQGGYADSR